MADAEARLERSTADVDLIALARDCLAAERDRRPRNAGAVVHRLTSHLASVQERLKTAELAQRRGVARAEEEAKRRAVADELAREAHARADEERKRRRMTAALAASVLVTFGVVGGGWAYLARKQAARLVVTTRVVSDALADAERLRGHARSAAVGDLTGWFETVSAARRARDLLAQGEPDGALQQRVDDTLTGVEQEHAAAAKQAADIERDRKLLAELEAIRGSRSEHWEPKQTDKDYAAAFRAFGIDLDQLDPDDAGKQVARRSAPVELASYLDDWALQRRAAQGKQGEAAWRRLLAAAKAADPDPWRAALRDQIGRDDKETLRRLAGDGDRLSAQSAPSVVLLAGALISRGDRELAERVLQRAWLIKPDDFWVNYALGSARWDGREYTRPDGAARYLSVAVAIRPRSSMARNDLGITLAGQGKLDEAIAEFREALRLNPRFAWAHSNLGIALQDQGKANESFAEFREALRLEPDNSVGHYNLGKALFLQGKLGEATAEYRRALQLKPDYPEPHNNLGQTLAHQGKVNEAIAEFREALRLKTDLTDAHFNLGLVFREQGRFVEALAELRRAHELSSKDPNETYRLAEWVRATARLVELDSKLPAILGGLVKPSDALETLGFAELCYSKKLHRASARFWSEAFQAQPKLAEDMNVQNRYNAACAAALAGSGQGKDDPPLDDAAKARWRKQAIDWLKADLAARSKILDTARPQVRQAVTQTLQYWKADTDLAGLRDAAALAKLPEDEKKTCRALWAGVDALLSKAGSRAR